MTLNEQQYETIMQALFEAREHAASLADAVGGISQEIAGLIDEAYRTLESEHYPPDVERDQVDDHHKWDANYKPGHSSDFPF